MCKLAASKILKLTLVPGESVDSSDADEVIATQRCTTGVTFAGIIIF
jgi:hypothetical protein